ncbi:MAG: GPO family capsid scaffolding protein [Salinisphaeraceae bacterium]
MAFKRVATEGATTDGRKLSREHLEQMARNYDPDKYGARIWIEHLRGLFPEGPLPAVGDVKALKTEENADGKLQLLADIDPTDYLKAMNEKRQKVYSSIEADFDFADTGEAYLIGLAVTDSPASLGTEMLQFSARQGNASPLTARKQRAENVFTVATELDTEFRDEAPATTAGADDDKPGLLDRVKSMFSKHKAELGQASEAFRQDVSDTLELLATKIKEAQDAAAAAPSADDFKQLQDDHAALKKQFHELHATLDKTPDQPARTPPTGGTGEELTNC